jgi:hypothetical protein
MMIKFTYCKNFAHAETKEVEWDDFSRVAVKSVGFDTKEQSIQRAAIVGGVRADETIGRAENIATRTMASLDYDKLPDGTTIDDVELALSLGLDCAFTAYSTFRHTPKVPRFRVFVPLSRPVSPEEYPAVIDALIDAIGLDGIDDCSYTVNQIMFLASHKHGTEPWHMSQAGDPWAVPDAPLGGIVRAVREDDDLSIAVINQPLDLTPDQVDAILENYPPNDLDYDDWLRVGMALYHQTEGNGYEKWLRWSEQSPKHDARQMKTKWRSFGGSSRPVTMASIIKASGGMSKSGVVAIDSNVALSLEAEAEQVSDRETYSAFKKRVQALNEIQLSPDIRSLLAKTVHEVYAKDAGMGLREVKASFKPIRGGRASGQGGGVDAVEMPGWLDGWVYGEADCVFINTTVSEYQIKREAFRAKFDRMPEVVAMETDAAHFALQMVQIPTVVRGMYWPGQDRMFDCEGKSHVNIYHPSGAKPCDALDEDGQGVVDLFLKHVRNTIADEREGDLLMDFMSYVYANPGKRVRWGMLLWGVEGNGKTYFYHVMQQLLGRNATVINTSMIERPFNDWAVGSRLIGIEEIRISGTNKWRVLDQLKPMISNDSIAVEPKGATRYHAPNFASYLMTTNHHDAVPISDNDRRYCVIFTRHRRQEDLFEQHGGRDAVGKYFDVLFSETNRRIDAIGRFLLDRQLSDEFDPQGRAPMTKGLQEMRRANVSDDRQAVEDAIENHASTIVSDKLIDVTHLKNCVEMDGISFPQTRTLANILRDMGYRQPGRNRVKVKGKYHYVWFRGSDDDDGDQALNAVRQWHDGGEDFSDVPF